MNHDVCNGDADGLCALRMWRLASPAESIVVTGLKRDIELVERVDAGAGDRVTVFDLSFSRNRPAALRLLERGAHLRWFDHHDAGELPEHPNFTATIEFDRQTCTSILVDQELGGRFRRWAIAAAYGDNLRASAQRLADTLALPLEECEGLRRFGVLINYNAYGGSDDDVHLHPAAVYRLLTHHDDPLQVAGATPLLDELEALRTSDLAQASAVAPYRSGQTAEVIVLPDDAWSRRVLGTYANERAEVDPQRAHAVLRQTADGFEISVRAPRGVHRGANMLCHEFGGGGRVAAAGIDRLPLQRLDSFVDRLATFWI